MTSGQSFALRCCFLSFDGLKSEVKQTTCESFRFVIKFSLAQTIFNYIWHAIPYFLFELF